MKRLFFILGIFWCTSTLMGQSKRDQYEDASDLVQSAIKKLSEGFVLDANKLVDSALTIYPTRDVLDYARELFKISDNSQAKLYIDKLYNAASAYSKDQLIIFDPPEVILAGMKRKARSYRKATGVLFLDMEAYNLNKEYGNIDYSIQLLKRLIAIDLHKSEWTGNALQDILRVQLALEERRFDDAITLSKKLPSKDKEKQMLVQIYFDQQNYPKALELVLDYGKKFPLYNQWLFKIYASNKNNEEAIKYWNKIADKDYEPLNQDYYFLGIIELNKLNYDSALAFFNKALNFRLTGKYAAFANYFLVNRHIIYKAFGDAYTGLKQIEKARNNYNIAILADPNYEPAITALTKLESSIATTTSTDKTPPIIAVTEPSVKRGLQITTSGNDIMVKGIAEDPSGLKSVIINDQSVYAQASGNFWGNVFLKDGLNKITIKATDGAGNIAEETFEITKNATTTSEPEIIAVTAKEGKNYCLLIAAQNYADASIPSLENPIQDAVRLKLVLKKNYRFSDEEIFTLFNPSANDIKRQLLELTNVIQPEDNLLIFYAGHGIWVEKEKKGYWLMTDAARNDPTTWVSNKEVLNLIAKLPSKHTLLITDACFSGGVFKTRSISKDAPSAIQMMDAKVSRVAITSGNDTEVPDQSVFMKYLVKALSENKDQYMPAQKMFITHIMEAVMTEGKTEPRYGTLELAGHVGGDFIFIKK